MTAFYVFIGGGLGAVLRFFIGKASTLIFNHSLPIGTFIANLFSCIVVGICIYEIGEGKWLGVNLKPLLIIGFCGGLSTFINGNLVYDNKQFIGNTMGMSLKFAR